MQKIFDSHFHIIDPRFKLKGNKGFIPDYYTVDDYLKELKTLNLDAVGGAVVSGSFQGYDQTYFEDALYKLGKNFVGITQLPLDTPKTELERLNKIGVKGIRFNLYRGLDTSLSEIEELSTKVYELYGWQTEFYINMTETSEELEDLILKLPKTSIDHLGMTKVPIEKLLYYLEQGVPIRLTGFGRVEYSREDILELVPKLYEANPNGLIFGTDLPSTRAAYRFSKDDIQLVQQVLDEEQCARVFYKNGLDWYLS